MLGPWGGGAVTCAMSCPSTISEQVSPPEGDSSDYSHLPPNCMSASEIILKIQPQKTRPQTLRKLALATAPSSPECTTAQHYPPQTVTGCPEPTCSQPEEYAPGPPANPWTVSELCFF